MAAFVLGGLEPGEAAEVEGYLTYCPRLPGRAGKTKVLSSVPPEARKYHTLLITEERVDAHPALSKEVTLKGAIP